MTFNRKGESEIENLEKIAIIKAFCLTDMDAINEINLDRYIINYTTIGSVVNKKSIEKYGFLQQLRIN